MLGHVQLLVHWDDQALLHKAALNDFLSQSVYTPQTAPSTTLCTWPSQTSCNSLGSQRNTNTQQICWTPISGKDDYEDKSLLGPLIRKKTTKYPTQSINLLKICHYYIFPRASYFNGKLFTVLHKYLHKLQVYWKGTDITVFLMDKMQFVNK